MKYSDRIEQLHPYSTNLQQITKTIGFQLDKVYKVLVKKISRQHNFL